MCTYDVLQEKENVMARYGNLYTTGVSGRSGTANPSEQLSPSMAFVGVHVALHNQTQKLRNKIPSQRDVLGSFVGSEVHIYFILYMLMKIVVNFRSYM